MKEKITQYFIKYSLVFILICATSSTYAAFEAIYLEGDVRDVNNKKIPLVSIKIYLNNLLIDSLQSDEKGKYKLELKEPNKVYIIAFSKPYFITAKIQVITNIPPASYTGKENYYDGFSPGVVLVGAFEGIDYKMFNDPVKYFKYS